MWEQIQNFFQAIWQQLIEALLYLGTPYDFAFAVLDITVLSFIFYQLLKLVRDSRAWQLLKGLLFIFFVGFVSNLVGLTALGFLLSRTISLFAIAFVVLFQPELRRALETVGRAGFKVVASDDISGGAFDHKIIESIVQACGEMAAKRTGALIVIERSTPLGDLEDQENAVEVGATISAAMLKQIFYVGSPLHDGAVLIRRGQIAAARIHVPLTDAYHLRKDLGTRHRAALGASEIGDTIAVVVSEERGTISIAIEGRLYTLDNEDALRTQLHRLLLPAAEERKRRIKLPLARKNTQNSLVGPSRKTKAYLLLVSILASAIFWFYVQISLNPVIEQPYNLQLLYTNQEDLAAKGLAAQYKIENIRVNLKGRKSILQGLSNRDVTAYVDLSTIDQPGLQALPVQVETRTGSYTQIYALTPESVSISVRPLDLDKEGN
ncbi:MAG: diadenylate cyclase CdaA [Eubacteriales bacterium]|nr:diadenylate cyclase CdaA [Clostridiales bacterium]MDY5835618.1 diadenylate cyclase CdaA [Eubacteriales bacterium]